MIVAYLSVSIVSFAVIGYPFNCLDGQLNCQAFTYCIIGRATKLSAVQSVIVAWQTGSNINLVPGNMFRVFVLNTTIASLNKCIDQK